MVSITHFFGEDVAWVYGTRDVVEIYLLCLNTITNSTIFEIDVIHALGDGALSPVNSPCVVIVETGRTGGVREVHVITAVAKGEDLLDGLVLRCGRKDRKSVHT